MQWWFKKFCKGVESLEYEEPRGWPSEADNKLRRSSKLIRLQLHKKSPKNSVSTILQLFATWSKLETWKSLIIGCLISWPKIKKKIILKCHLLLFYATTTKPFLNRIVTCDEKWILHDNQQWPAQCLDWEGVPKHFSKSNLHSKKVMITVWWSAASLIHDSFLKTGKTITSEKCTQQMDEMHWKLPVLQGCSCRLH